MIALAVGLVASRPDSGAMAVFTSRHVGGQTARRMLPIALAIPVLGFLALLAQRTGLYKSPGAAVVEGVAGMIAAIAITLAVGHSLERTDADRRRVEEQSREWKRFFDRATFGEVFGTLDVTFGCVNEAFARMHGYTVEELEGRPVLDVFPPERLKEFAEKMAILQARGGVRWESEHVRKDGSVFPVVVDVSIVRDDQGRDLYRAAYVQDITQEKEAEAVRSRLASLVQSTDDAIVTIAADGTVLDWNRGAERIYGYRAREVVGRSIAVIIPGERRAEFDALLDRARAGETVVAVETERLRKDGRRIPIALTLSPILDAVGHVIGFSKIERDISVLKQLERERQEWGAVVAHELRQPAATVRLAADSLARGRTDPSGQRAVERIRRAGDRLERMIQDLLDVSRIEARQLTVKPEPTDLSPLVAEVIQLVPEVARRCRTVLAPDATSAWVDTNRFVQVLSNLLSNADKYGDPGTLVEVRTERVGTMVQVSVTNEGPGIAPDEIPRLFSRFARTRSAQSGATPGLGLGLYICRGIVQAHGGELWVQSIPGEKTHFRFTLPRAEGGEPRPTSPALLH
jgi:PAS domain S-box-containing protein